MMKMQMRAATSSAFEPGKRNGANRSPARISSMATLSSARPGGSSETNQPGHEPVLPPRLSFGAGASAAVSAKPPAVSCIGSMICPAVIAASMMLGEREQAARPPQQDQRHQQNVGAERELRRQETGVVGSQADQNRADEAAADRTEPADDQNDEHQDGHAVADLAVHHGLILRPHHPAGAGERGAGHEHADEHPADVVAERLDHLAILDAGAHHKAKPRAGEEQMHSKCDRKPDEQREQPVGL